MKRLVALIILLAFQLVPAEANATLQKTTVFAMGGIGVAGKMSEGERALRGVLARSDAVARLERMLPGSSAPGQLYALLGLRSRDRDAYKRALAAYGRRNITVQTMRGCSIGPESFRDLVKQIDHGDYDSALARPWPERFADRQAVLVKKHDSRRLPPHRSQHARSN